MNGTAGADITAKARRLIEDRKLDEAISHLESNLHRDDGGELHALLGLSYFHEEEYAKAAESYAKALGLCDGGCEGEQAWTEMLARARTNAGVAIGEFVPPESYFERSQLLAPPDGPMLPPAPEPVRPTLFQRLLISLGRGLGKVISGPVHWLVYLHGTLLGYQDEVWTNWYRRGPRRAVLTLAYMRDLLNERNLGVAYPEGELIGFQDKEQIRPQGVTHFRTADGSWNNLDDPKEGAAGTRFARNVENKAIHPEPDEELLSPDPRLISRRLLTRAGEGNPPAMDTVPFLNLLAASWIQFQNHDWVSHGENDLEGEPIEIELAEDDPIREKYGQATVRISRTQRDPTYGARAEAAEITYINEVTHWWDGSQIYGSDQKTQDRLRSGEDGTLKLENERLPVGIHGVEDTGFNRNWWVGLSMLHTLFVKEHNAICKRLKQKYPHWNDDRVFNVARLVNAAVMAKIHTVEWTPAILPNPGANLALHANWYGIATFIGRRRKNWRTKSWLNIAQPEAGGVVGNRIDKHGAAYGLTEEFVEVYRLHSLLPEALELRRLSNRQDVAEKVPVPETRQAGSPVITSKYEMADLFVSFGKQHPGYMKLNNFPRFLQELSVPGSPVLDMGTVDILRARERGVPRYNAFREQLQLKPIRSFEDLGVDRRTVDALEDLYGRGEAGVGRLDLLVGTLAEDASVRPTNFGFGETLFQIFILNATRRLQADRFYTDSYNEETYTKEGLDWIDDADLKTVLLRHYPELAKSGLANVRNAFEPWDEGPVLDARRHPLRAYDDELGADPWTGDAYRVR